MRHPDDLCAGPEEEEVIERDPCEECGETALAIMDVDVRSRNPRQYWVVYTLHCPTCGHTEKRDVGGEWD